MTRSSQEAVRAESLQLIGSISTNNIQLLKDADMTSRAIRQILVEVGASVLGESVYQFADDYGQQSGFTALFLLSESHVAIHTWPEHGCAEIDTYLCNYLRDNRDRCSRIFHAIAEHFSADELDIQHVERRRLRKQND